MTDTPGSTTNATVTVSEHDTLPKVLDRLRAAGGQAVTLEIPEHSPVFLTATEFRTLRDTLDRAGTTVHLVTEDPLRLQLASMFGLVDFERPTSVDHDGHTDREMESTPSFSGWRAARARHMSKAADPGTDEDPIAVSRKRRAELYEPGANTERAGRNGNVGLSEDATLVSLSYLEDDDTGTARAQLIGRIVAAVAVVALIAGVAAWYYLPAVTVDASLRQGQIGTELLYSVTRPGADAPIDAAFAVEAEEVSDTVSFDISVPATGRQVTPDGTASGAVTLRNASSEAVTIASGTELPVASGVRFVTTEDVEVPPGSADGSTIGEAQVPVTATEPGAGGNLGVGEVSGKIADQPVYFANREAAMSGGSDIEVAVVSEEDLATLQTQVESDLRRAVAEDWTAQLPDGQMILAPSVEVGEPEFTIEQAAGDVSETATLTGTVEATGLEYDAADVQDQARSSYQEALAAQVPPGYELLVETVTLGEPQLVAEAPDSIEYTMSATATVRAIFDDGAEQRLSEDLSGADAERAESILGNVPAFETWSVSRDPGWWFDRMPQSAGRITVSIADPVATAALPPGTPAATPAAGEDGS
ncbi:MAG: baseplate J/gp47 family protein [Chloroflexota bacterium]|nr:baseplate J/gp47 family protein [Chloroflexota bacterium]